MKEKELKRKRELEGEEDNVSDFDGPEKEKPREGMKTKTAKKQKLDHAGDDPPKSENATMDATEESQQKKSRAEKRKEKTQRKKEKLAKKEEKAKAKRARKEASKREAQEQQDHQPIEEPSEDEAITASAPPNDMETVDVTGLTDDQPLPSRSTASPSPAPGSTFSHASAQPSTSSASSAPISDTATTHNPTDPTTENPKPKLPAVDKEALKARLEAKIAALRAFRKADGPDGRPARSRQELIEARRKKQELRKQHKKELRKQAREEEVRAQAEAELARLRGSGSPLGSPGDLFSPSLRASPDGVGSGVSYGRVVWGDGGRVSADGLRVEEGRKKKGPADPRTALEAAERKRARLEGMEEGKRRDVEEKEAWLNAKKKVHGERVKDDTSLLKNALKRKEQQKRKSGREWGERINAVEKGMEMRQKKREENLRKRKEEKGGRGKGVKPGDVVKKKVKRPGFEGSFRARSKK